MRESFSAAAPATLDRAGIALRIPHQGRMCLLDRLLSWSPEQIHCAAENHSEPDHPLRSASGLLSPCAIEYAAQAMALHGALLAPPAAGPRPGYLASVRNVRLAVARLDGVAGPLQVRAERLAGEDRQVMYRFELSDGHGRRLVDGRATVVLDTPLAREPATQDPPSPRSGP